MKHEITQSSASQQMIGRRKADIREAGQSASASSLHFSATLLRPKATGRAKAVSWSFLTLPNEASDKLPSRGMVSVEGTLNGFPIRVTLEPDGRGGHWLKVDRKLVERAGAATGDIVQLEITPVAEEPEPCVPSDLRKALAAAPHAQKVWSDITPIARRDWIQWITSGKRAETRALRIDKACYMLAKGKRRPCCFDRSGLYSKSLGCPVADNESSDTLRTKGNPSGNADTRENQTMKRFFTIIVIFSLTSLASAAATPLKVFILAGQSNMEGHAKVETFDYIGDDPATAPLLKKMRDSDGKPHMCDHVWISYYTGVGDANGEGHGKLTAGYGSRSKPQEDGGNIGPEFTFGLTMDEALQEPVLIIKTAWGGKSLFHDFRPPSAGVYHRTAADVEKQRYLEKDSGLYYRLMIEHVKHVLGDIKRVCPAYADNQGFQISGFVWLQGWNDMVNHDVYPTPDKGGKEPGYADYSLWMADFIRDVRKDLNAPGMPFVIGVMGIGGSQPNRSIAAFREAMARPAALPEFQGNVVAVETAPFWDEKLGAIADKHDQVRQMGYFLKTKNKNNANADGSMTEQQQRDYLKQFEAKLISPEEAALWKRGASNAGYHYLGCAKTFALMGRAFAESSLSLMKSAGAR